MSKNIWVVVPAAGCGKRMGCDTPKQYLSLAGHSMIDWTLSHLLQLGEVTRVVVAVAREDQQFAQQALADHLRVRRVAGGATRAESVLAGLGSLEAEAAADDVVLVHDAARPLIHPEDVRRVMAAVAMHAEAGAVLATPVADTLKRATTDGRIAETVPRDGLWQAQTPQAATFGVLLPALAQVVDRGDVLTDEAGALEAAGVPVHLVAAAHPNFKLTTPVDMALAAAVLAGRERR